MADDTALQSDDFIVYGTAVEQLADDETGSSKPVPIQDQVATDEKGRRRFHGAFTGGFSAGYFNTVGSIEGWTPRTFQSSRQKKGESSQQRPEDYMDTEDFTAHGIAPKKITTTDSFSSRATEGTHTYGVSGAEIPLKALLAPPKESYGIVLLKKMGWKPGQGIGPRITKRQKYLRLLKEGKIVAISEATLQAEEKLSAGKLFAPDDTKRVALDPKTNYHGIGYTGLDMSSGLLKASTQRFSLFDVPEVSTSLAAVPTASAKQKKIRGMTGQAFGVGAFENDDEDIYTMDDMSRYDRVLGDAEKGAARKEAMKSIEAPGAAKIVEGFVRGTIPLHQTKIFPAPVLPRGFTGQHGVPLPSIPDEALKRSAEPPPPDRHHHPQHDAKSRAVALDDQPNQPKAQSVIKSVFDLIPAAQKSRIPSFQKASLLEEGTSQSSKSSVAAAPEMPVRNVAPPLPTPVASVEEMRRNSLALFSGAGSVTADSKITFQPFAKDPAKQQRYEMFLQRRHIKGTVALAEIWMDVGSSMTEWEREREKGEFHRAAALYRPMSGLMAARFTRETDSGEVSNTVEVSVDTGDVDKDRKAAAEKKLYGKLTRDVFEWHPDRLVCKRFNVPNPYPTSTLVGILKVKRDKFSMFNFLNVPEDSVKAPAESTAVEEAAAVTTPETLSQRTEEPKLSPAVSVLPSEPKKLTVTEKPTRFNPPPPPEVEVPTERPPMDLFRAIFDTSDVEEDPGNDEQADLFPTLIPPLPPASSSALPIPVEVDPLEDLLNLDKKARALERKEFSTKPEGPAPVIGPERPSAAMLANYAMLGAALKRRRRDSDSSDEAEDRQRRKRRKEKTKKSDKKHKKSKKHKREKSKRSSNDSTDSDTVGPALPRIPPSKPKPKDNLPRGATSVRVPATESSPDIDASDLSTKLKQLMPGKRLTAADFM
ncbi:G patch domain-containing protein 1 [Hypsibius exemplaris]|uniref:G patch domain-containing protein 1 n=1 Tax=Hypsibius exemplaris TaxID=2072580 RepID=A0A1W0X7P9_HYPEX|nr:G patch domain-containing protein 1 [Hypsibius exemplaris]